MSWSDIFSKCRTCRNWVIICTIKMKVEMHCCNKRLHQERLKGLVDTSKLWLVGSWYGWMCDHFLVAQTANSYVVAMAMGPNTAFVVILQCQVWLLHRCWCQDGSSSSSCWYGSRWSEGGWDHYMAGVWVWWLNTVYNPDPKVRGYGCSNDSWCSSYDSGLSPALTSRSDQGNRVFIV